MVPFMTFIEALKKERKKLDEKLERLNMDHIWWKQYLCIHPLLVIFNILHPENLTYTLKWITKQSKYSKRS